MTEGCIGPQGVGHLLGLEALDGEHSLPGGTIQQLSAGVVPQRGIRPQGVGDVLHSTQGRASTPCQKSSDQRLLGVGMLLG